MRINRLDVTDFVATVLVAAAATIYFAGLAGADIPGFGGVRARASAVFVLGLLACATGARRDAFSADASRGRLAAMLTALGVMTLVVGVTAIVLGSSEYLAALMVGIGLLWLGTTARHLITEPAVPTIAQTEHRELVKR